jgi:uncharacterized protein YecT (DUF1311 family)
MTSQTHAQISNYCKDTSKVTQMELNECAGNDLKESELRMAKLLKQLGIAPESPEQKAWESYRDAQLSALYPREGAQTDGSVYPMCLAILRKALTDGRIRDLEALRVSGEGDVCYGYEKNNHSPN